MISFFGFMDCVTCNLTADNMFKPNCFEIDLASREQGSSYFEKYVFVKKAVEGVNRQVRSQALPAQPFDF